MTTTIRKWAALLVALVMIFSLVACGQNEPTDATTTTTAVTTTTAQEDQTTTVEGEPTTTEGNGVTTTVNKPVANDTTNKPTTSTATTTVNKPWKTWNGTTTTKVTTTKTTVATTVATTVVTKPDAPVESTSRSMLQTYLMAGHDNQPTYQSKQQFAVSVGYYPDGDLTKDPVDTMIDTYIILGSPNYHSDAGASGGLRVMDKETIEAFYDCEFKTGVNLDALNAATGELKAVLNKPNYKVNVFLPYVYAHPDCYSFGEVKGKNLDLSIEEDRFAAMEWQIDEQLRRFEEQNYEHIQVIGFFLMTEHVYVESDTVFHSYLSAMTTHVNEYVASLGYETLVNPFNHEGTNHYRWKEASFSRATMQINHFPAVKQEDGSWSYQLNHRPSIDSIRIAAELTAQYDIGITLEWSCMGGGVQYPETEGDGVMYVKRYLEGGVKYGYMNRPFFNMQFDGGPNSVYNDCVISEDAYTRSVYDELYKFVKGTLTVDDIRWYKDFQ